MSVVDAIRRGAETRSAILGGPSTLGAPSEDLVEALGGAATVSGKRITADGALRLAAVYSAVRVLAETVRILPLETFRPADDGSHSERAPDSRLWTLLHETPNPELPASEMWELITGWLNLRGNAYIFKRRDGFGRVIELWPVAPQQVMVGRYEGTKVYAVYPYDATGRPPYADEVPAVATNHEILHLRAFGTNGLSGLSPVGLMREKLGWIAAQEEYQTRMLVNNGRPSGILSTEQELSTDAAKKLLARWRANHSGLENSARVALLDLGMKWQQTSLSMVDAQFIEQTRGGVQDVARMYRLPPKMLNAESGSSMTYSNTEMEGIDFLTYTMLPQLDRIESPIRHDPDLQLEPGIYSQFNVERLLRVQTLERFRAYWFAIASGWMNRQEVRQRENLPKGPTELETFRPMTLLKDPPLRAEEPDGEQALAALAARMAGVAPGGHPALAN